MVELSAPAPALLPASDHLEQDLARWFGHTGFRSGQREVVESALQGRDTLAVLPTGGGKSLTYQLPAMLVDGATLVLSPLIALMKDQAENLPPDVAARTTVINSSLDSSEVGKRLAMVKAGRIKMVYAAPERLRQPTFLHALRRANVSLVVVDEAHCISQWGHDFRPDYRAVGKAVQALNPRSVLAVTATATPSVQNDIEEQLGRNVHRLVRPTHRDNLYLSCHRVQGEDEKLNVTLDLCKTTDGVGLVYAGSREKCEQLSRMLTRHGIKAGFYHAGLPPNERAQAQDRFMSGDVRVMAATVAFGMGVDKADIRFLVHYHPSRTLENYYQEAGRAGRDGLPSSCTLMYSASDAAGTTRRLREDTLDLDGVKAVYNAVRRLVEQNGRRENNGRVGPVAFGDLIDMVGGDEGLLRATLPLLEEAQMLSRTVDIPRRMTLHPEYAPLYDEDAPAMPPALAERWHAFAPLIGESRDWNPVDLSNETQIPLAELEETVLSLQDAGKLTYRASARDLLVQIVPPPPDAKERMAQMLAQRGTGAKHRADAMLAYARDNKCRHAQIARYFGDRWPHKNCGNCDVCAPKAGEFVPAPTATPTVDAHEAPLYALRAIADLTGGRSAFALGRAGLMRLLRGTPDAPVRPERTPMYGTLASLRKADVERLLDALVEHGYVYRDENDDYRRLYLTAEGENAVHAQNCDIHWQTSAPAPSTPTRSKDKETAVPDDADPDLFEALRTWRRNQAEAESVPPFVVFSDKVLLALASSKPVNEIDLLDVSGIGPAKAGKYGEAVLEQIRKFAAQ
jgi:ATP-dependent DNA helicase RecQ